MHLSLKVNDIQTKPFKLPLQRLLAPLIISACFLVNPILSFGQETALYADPSYQFKEAQGLYQQGLYAEAQPMFRKTIADIGYFQETNRQLVLQNAQYYFNMCALQLNQPDAVDLSKKYLRDVDNNPRKQLTAYNLARYYFRHNQLEEAIPYYEQAGFDNLSNNDIAEAKFELGYCYFNMKEFNKAQPLFNAIKDVHNQYYIPANYYYGFISYYNKNYSDALQSFQRVVNEPKYDLIVPYYIAEIYYYQDKPEKVISYAQSYLVSGNLYYNNDLKHLVGQTYFEQKEYSKALPYLKEYEAGAKTLTKEDVYELAYCYYQGNDLPKAIAGFKQLSGTEDSLGQNSMYLLGDCYLRTGQKSEARNAFAFCARSNYNPKQQEISRFNYGKLSYELGYQDAAINTLKEFTTEYPNSGYSTEAQELLAHLFMNTNDYKNALNAISSVPKTSQDAQRAYQRITFGRAVQLINDGDLSQSNDLLDKSLQYPVDPQMQQLAYFWKGEIALRQGNPEGAIVNTNQYLALGGNEPAALGEANVQTAHYNLGYSYLKRKEYTQALQQFQLAQHVFGANGRQIASDATLRTADCYYMLKNYTDAQNLYNKAISSGQSGSDYALYQKGIIAGVTGNTGQKISLMQQLSNQYPKSSYNSDADYQIAATYMTNEQYNLAVPYLQKVVNNPDDPNAAKALLQLGVADFNLNDQQGAISSYQKVVTQYPNSPQANDALQSLRTLYINGGQPDAYLNFLKSTGRTVTVSAEDSITYAAGESSFGNNQYASAITQLTNYLNKFSNGQFVLPAHFYLAESYFNQKDYNNALTNYAYVLSQSASLYSERSASQAAWISFYQNKNYQQALVYFTQLKQLSTSKENTLAALRGALRCSYQLSQWPQVSTSAQNLLQTPDISTDDQIVGYFYLARAQQQQNEYDSAIANYKTVAQMTKSELGAESRYFISQCYFAQNDLTNATNAAYDVIKNTPSYDYWVASAYIMLGNIFWKQNDYFNAKATLQSIVDNCKIPELVTQASNTLAKVKADEQSHSKIRNANRQNQ